SRCSTIRRWSRWRASSPGTRRRRSYAGPAPGIRSPSALPESPSNRPSPQTSGSQRRRPHPSERRQRMPKLAATRPLTTRSSRASPQWPCRWCCLGIRLRQSPSCTSVASTPSSTSPGASPRPRAPSPANCSAGRPVCSVVRDDAELAGLRQRCVEGIDIDGHRVEVLDPESGGTGFGHLEGCLTKPQFGEDVVHRLKRLIDFCLCSHPRDEEPGGDDVVIHDQILPFRACSAESSRVPPRPSPYSV